MEALDLFRTERIFVMEHNKKKKKPGTRRRTRPLPEQFICIAPTEAPLVFDWLKGAGSEAQNEIAEIHLRLCFQCQEAVITMMRLNSEFRENVRRFLHSANEQARTHLSRHFTMTPVTSTPRPYGCREESARRSMKAGGGN